jgi:redox-sensitive bicupin YhaK (pirin superfamily)
VFAGAFNDAKASGLPPPDSWAADARNDVAVWHIELPARARVRLPPATIGREANRRVFLYDAPAVTVDGKSVQGKQYLTLWADTATTIVNDNADAKVELLMLQG